MANIKDAKFGLFGSVLPEDEQDPSLKDIFFPGKGKPAPTLSDVVNPSTQPTIPAPVTLPGIGTPSPVTNSSQPLAVAPTAPTTPTPAPAPAPGLSESDAMGMIRSSRVPATNPTMSERGIAGTITDGKGNVIEVPKAKPVDKTSEFEDLISQVMKDPSSRVTQNMGLNQGTKTGGLKTKALALLGETYKAQLGLEGHKITADIASDIRRGTLEEKVRHNNLLQQDFNLKLSQQKDVADQKALESTLGRFAVHEADPMNPGEKSVNMRATYFNIWDSGTKPHSAIEPAVKQMGDAYQAYKNETIRLSNKKALTPAEEIQTKARFRKSLSQYPEIASK